MCNWICVKERTPTSNESVMVGSFDDYGNNGIAKAWFANDNWYLDYDGLRATDDHCIYIDMIVTHWQPLYQPHNKLRSNTMYKDLQLPSDFLIDNHKSLQRGFYEQAN